MGDALCGIVCHHGELVGPTAVCTQQHEVADVAGKVLRVLPDHAVGKRNVFVWHADAPCGRFAVFRLPLRIFAAACAVVHKAVRALPCGGVPFFAAAIAGIRQTEGKQFVQRGAVERMARALIHGFAVPLKAEGFQRVQNVRCRACHFARGVYVFHADKPSATVGAGIGIGSERGQQRTDVQKPRGAGRKTPDIRLGHGFR